MEDLSRPRPSMRCLQIVEDEYAVLRAPEIVVATWRSARPEIEGLPEAEIRAVLAGLDPLWDELFPAEQARIVQLLVERVDLASDAAAIRIRTAGIEGLVESLRPKA